MALTDRQRALLAAVVERYVNTAEAVGSAALTKDARLVQQFGALSSATIRNDLKALEGAGFLAHPHTSAGRVPTHAGYRLYINEMMRPRPVRPADRARIDAAINAPALSVENILQQTTALLSQMSGYPAVASLPTAQRDAMRHVEINHIPPHRLILILVTATGRIEHRLFEIDGEISQSSLRSVVDFLNKNLGGRSLAQLHGADWEQLSPEATRGLHGEETITLARAAWKTIQEAIAELGDEGVVIQGTAALFDEPEFSQIESARAVFRIFEDALHIGEMLRQAAEVRNVLSSHQFIIIGDEWTNAEPLNPMSETLQNLSFVGIRYGTEDTTLGTIGVIGPTRMKYGKTSALTLALAKRLQESLVDL